MIDILLLLAGFVLLIFGADKLVDGASALAKRFGIPNIVIGLTIVAFGTSAPEFVVNLFASLSNNTEMVLGNVIGSNIFNVLGILGISALLYPLTVQKNTTWIEIPLSFLAAIMVLVLANDVFLNEDAINVIDRSEGVILLCFFIIFLVYNLQVAKNDKQLLSDEPETTAKQMTVLKSVIFIVIGLTGLIVGGRFIVMGAVSIATMLGISERIIGLTIVSIGTSLPELATSIVAVRKKNVDIAIGNVVGSNIFNIFFILGVSTVVTPVPILQGSQFDIIVNMVASLLLFAFIFTGKGRKLQRWEGGVLLILYIGYVIRLLQDI